MTPEDKARIEAELVGLGLDLNNAGDLLGYIEETLSQRKPTKWIRVSKSPPMAGCYVLIKTPTSLVRVARRRIYTDGSDAYCYQSITYKNVMWWQPLPK